MSGHARRPLSPSELVAELRAGRGAPRVIDARSVDQLHCVTLAFESSGQWQIPSLGFHGVMIATGHGELAVRGAVGGGRALRLGAGTTVVLQPHVRAQYTWRSSHELLIGCVDPTLVLDIGIATGMTREGRLALPDAFETRDTVGAYLLSGISDEMQRPPHAAQGLILQSLANALACRVLDGHVERELLPPLRGGLSAHALRRVQAYVEENFGKRISLEELAKVAGVTRFHFARQFRVSVGESPMQYLTRVRIEHAKRMLREGGVSGADIASSAGFADQSHFARTFRRIVGVSPRRFMQEDVSGVGLPRIMRRT